MKERTKDILEASRDFLKDADETLESSRQMGAKRRFESLLPEIHTKFSEEYVRGAKLGSPLDRYIHENCTVPDGDYEYECHDNKLSGGFHPLFTETDDNVEALAYQAAFLGEEHIEVRMYWDQSYASYNLFDPKRYVKLRDMFAKQIEGES